MFIWNPKKLHKYHEINPETGKTFCKLENSGFCGLDEKSDSAPSNRRFCAVCEQIKSTITKQHQKKSCSLATRYNFLNSDQWKELRYRTLLRYGRRCLCCGASAKRDGVRIHVDHVKPRSKYPELALDINNLQTLCADCNHGKGNWDETDFRSNA